MRDFRDAKLMAQSLREALSAKLVTVSHSESLELVARAFGVHSWNELSAAIQLTQNGPGAAISPAHPTSVLPILPLRDTVLFPGMEVPLFVGRAETKRAIDHAAASDHRILVVTQRRVANDRPSAMDLYSVGVVAQILRRYDLPDGSGVKLLVKPLERAFVSDVSTGEFLSAATKPLRCSDATNASDIAAATLSDFWLYRNATATDSAYAHLPGIHDANALADAIAPHVLVSIAERQNLLETAEVAERLETIRALMNRELKAA